MHLNAEQRALLRELSHGCQGKWRRNFDGMGSRYFSPIPRHVRYLELAGFLERATNTTNGTGPDAAWFVPTWAGRLAASPVLMDRTGRLASQAGQDDLHEFCHCHGISSKHFQDSGAAVKFPHYRLPNYQAAQWALYNGARLVGAREFLKFAQG